MTITFVGKVLDPGNPTNFSGVNRRFFSGRPQFGLSETTGAFLSWTFASYNASNSYFVFYWAVNTDINATFVLRVQDSSGNYSDFSGSSSSYAPMIFYVDPSFVTPIATSGTLNLSDVVITQVSINSTATTGFLNFLYLGWIERMVFTGGMVSAPLQNSTLASELIYGAAFLSATYQQTIFATNEFLNYFRTTGRLQIGNNDATYYGVVAGSLVSQDNQELSSAFIQLGADKREVILNISVSQVISNIQIIYKFLNQSSGTITLQDVLFITPYCELGTAVLSRVSFINSGIVKGGNSFTGVSFTGSVSSYAYDWNEVATFANVSFTGSADHYVRIGSDNVANNSSIDVSSIEFDTPGITHFLIDGVTGVEITTAPGATLTKTEINGGTATFVTPQATLTLTNLVADSRVYVQNTTDDVELFNEIEATTTWSETVPSGKTLLIRVRNASGTPKYKPFQTTTGALTLNTSIVINQELDE